MRLFTRWLGALLSMLALGLLAAAPAQAELAVPPLSGRVVDQTGTLTPVQAQALEAKLARFEAEAGPQIVLLLVASTQPEDIAAYAWRVADQWKVGRREVGDGVLVVVAKGDRRVRIEVAKALEGAVPDLAARQIIDRAIKPAFQQNDYAGGLNAGVDQLTARIRGEHLPVPQPRSGVHVQNGNAGGDSLGGWQSLALFFFLGVPVAGSLLSAMLGRKLGSVATAGGAGTLAGVMAGSWPLGLAAGLGALVLVGLLGIGSTRRGRGGRGGGGFIPPVIWGGGGGGWSGGGNSDGGGFSSGGGGDFGGGGASGDW